LSTSAIVRIYSTIALLTGGLYFLYQIRSILLLLLMAVFLAVALGPAVDALTRRHVSRAAAILMVYAALLGIVVGIGLVFVPPMASGVQSIARDAPNSISNLRTNATVRKYDNRYHITQKLEKQTSTLPSKLSRAAAKLSSVTVGAFGEVVRLITVLAIAFFLMLDGRRMLAWCLDRFPARHATRVRDVAQRIYRAISGYIAGNLAISVVAGTVAFVTLSVLDVPYALPLSVLVGFFDLIPLVGATTGAIIVGLVTLVHGFPTSTIVWAIVQIVYQQVENNAITPIVYRRTVKVHGLVTLLAILIGSLLLGVLGALLAIPVAAAIQIVLAEVVAVREEERADQDGTSTPSPEAEPAS
jgi:predicted PurR-regulated permease PerM